MFLAGPLKNEGGSGAVSSRREIPRIRSVGRLAESSDRVERDARLSGPASSIENKREGAFPDG